MKKIITLEEWKIWLLIGLILLGILLILKKIDEDFERECINNGFSKEYCEVHK